MLRASILILVALAVAIDAMGYIQHDCEDDVKYKCPKGYKLFEKRKNGPWCMKVFNGNKTWWEAERECRCSVKGATLSGIESFVEKKWVEQTVQSMFDAQKIKDGSVWIGAYRRKVCPSGPKSHYSKNVNCNDEKLFQFTDRHTCGTYIFQSWANRQPTHATGDNCGVLVVSTESDGVNADQSGKPADKKCLQVNGPSPLLSSYGFVCGVKPIEHGGNSYSGHGGGEVIIIGEGKPGAKH